MRHVLGLSAMESHHHISRCHSFSTTPLLFTPSLRLPGQPEQQEPYRLHLAALQRPAETLLAKPPR